MVKTLDFLFNIDKANKELMQVHNYLLSIADKITTHTNLKLYDAFYESGDKGGSDAFYDFCEMTFDAFNEEIKEQTGKEFYKNVHYIGRTSSFYCVNDDLYNNIVIDVKGLNLPDTIYNLFNDLWGWNGTWLNFDKGNGFIDANTLLDDMQAYNAEKDDINNELLYIINGEFLEDIKKAFSTSLFIWDLIAGYKENQVNDFVDFVECNADIYEIQEA